MGVNVNLYVEADPTENELAKAEAFFAPRTTIGEAWDKDDPRILAPCEYAPGRVVVHTFSRYYGPGYERGSWPMIYGDIRLLQAVFPGSTVFYGGDTSDDGEPCTPEFLAEIWDHFLGASGDAYRERSRAWNAAHA